MFIVIEEKVAEAETANSPTLDALRQGVGKLEEKLAANKQELSEFESGEPVQNSAQELSKEASAADLAIAKAQARAKELATMSDTEKAQAQLNSLKTRLEKARTRLAKAEADNDENIEAFRAGVEKLEAKLAEAEAN